MENLLLNLLGSSADFPAWLFIIIIVTFFGIIVAIVILVKRKIKPLQIKKDELTEEEAAKQELDRILVEIKDEDIQKQMNEESDEK